MYPALVNCTTVIYFSEWPYEALIDVAHYFLTKFDNEIVKNCFCFIKFYLRFIFEIRRKLANLCAFIHLSTKTLAIRMKDEFRREIYITPTNYLQFVRNYSQY